MATDRPEPGASGYTMAHQVLDKMERNRGLERGELDGQTYLDQKPAGQFALVDKFAIRRRTRAATAAFKAKQAAEKAAKQLLQEENNG